MTQNGLRPGSIQTALSHLRKILKNDMAADIRDITAIAAENMYERLVQEGLAVDTHRNMLAAAKLFAKWCVEKKYIKVSPFASVKGRGRRKRGKPQLMADEAKRLLDICLHDGSPAATAVHLCLVYGMRASEVSNLQVRHIDCTGTVIVIRGAKTAAGDRRLVVQDETLRQQLLDLATGKSPDQLLFGERGFVPTRHWVYRECRRHCELAGVRNVTPHGLRGTMASLATSHSAAPAAVMAAMGHKSPYVTQRHYVTPDAKHLGTVRQGLASLPGEMLGKNSQQSGNDAVNTFVDN